MYRQPDLLTFQNLLDGPTSNYISYFYCTSSSLTNAFKGLLLPNLFSLNNEKWSDVNRVNSGMSKDSYFPGKPISGMLKLNNKFSGSDGFYVRS